MLRALFAGMTRGAGLLRSLGWHLCRELHPAAGVQLSWSRCLFVIHLFPFDLLLLLPFTVNKSSCPVMFIPRSVSGASSHCLQPGCCKAQPSRWLRSHTHPGHGPPEMGPLGTPLWKQRWNSAGRTTVCSSDAPHVVLHSQRCGSLWPLWRASAAQASCVARTLTGDCPQPGQAGTNFLYRFCIQVSAVSQANKVSH